MKRSMDCPYQPIVVGKGCVKMGIGYGKSQHGHGGTHGGWFMGDRLLTCVTERGVITGWLLETVKSYV